MARELRGCEKNMNIRLSAKPAESTPQPTRQPGVGAGLKPALQSLGNLVKSDSLGNVVSPDPSTRSGLTASGWLSRIGFVIRHV
jgi:hypothetical protein